MAIVGFNFSKITAEKFIKSLPKFIKFLQSHSEITFSLDPNKTSKDGKFKGHIYVFSGFRDKSLEKYIEDNGGEVSNTVNENTNHAV